MFTDMKIMLCTLEQICRLQDLVKKSEQGLGSAECHITSLKDAQDRLQNELDITRERLRETSDSLFTVQVTIKDQYIMWV